MGLAYEVGRRSMALTEAKDREGWLALFSAHGSVEDPVGPSLFDPDGKGHHGIEAITAFYDNVISMSERVRFEIRQSSECAGECAFAGTIHITLPDGKQGSVDLINIYRADPEGKIASLRSFWEFEKLSFG